MYRYIALSASTTALLALMHSLFAQFPKPSEYYPSLTDIIGSVPYSGSYRVSINEGGGMNNSFPEGSECLSGQSKKPHVSLRRVEYNILMTDEQRLARNDSIREQGRLRKCQVCRVRRVKTDVSHLNGPQRLHRQPEAFVCRGSSLGTGSKH